MDLLQYFLEHARAQREALAAAPGLGGVLEGLLEAGRSKWPDLNVPPEAFMRHLAERLPQDREPLSALGAMHASDLYVACGCSLGEPQALRAFEEHFLSQLPGYLRRWDALPTIMDDVKQTLRAMLLVGVDGAPPRIAGYGGQGPLAAWVRIVATRTAFRLQRAQKDLLLFDGDSPATTLLAPGPDPELAYLKSRHGAELEAAFRSTLAALDARERTILRFHFLDGMNAEAIAAIYKVSKRTAERWLSRTRERVLTETRNLLAEKLKMDPSELDTLLGLVRSELNISVRKLLTDSGTGTR